MAEPSGNPPGPPHACRTRTLRVPSKTPLAGDKIDAPAACAFPFRPYCGGVVTRTRNVSEYMLVLALCLVPNIDNTLTEKLLSHYSRTPLLIQLVNVPPSGRKWGHLKEVAGLQVGISKYNFYNIFITACDLP